MRILQLCHRVPWPLTDGGNIAMLNLAESLSSQGAQIKIFALNTVKHHVDLSSLPNNIFEKYSIEAVSIDTTVKIKGAFSNFFSKDSYNIVRFYDIAFEEKLWQLLMSNTYDIVLLESIFMTPYINCIRSNSKAKIVMRAHNVEHIIWQRLEASEKNVFKKTYLKFLTNRLKQYEVDVLNKADSILPITPDDEKLMRKLGSFVPMHVTPVGVNLDDYPNQIDNVRELSLFHLGSMDWMPNLEGISWFLNDCWPKISWKFPSLKLYLAGRGFPPALMKNAPSDVICEGEIADAKQYMLGKQIMIVPLKSGSGMRVKIIQGMALGKTIISTSIGAEGINYTNGKDILIADSPSEFLLQIEKCMANPAQAYEIGNNARTLVAKEYSNEAIGKGVMDFLKSSVVA
jgi:glycosyltransferase involved in cell wall biosynthesis